MEYYWAVKLSSTGRYYNKNEPWTHNVMRKR